MLIVPALPSDFNCSADQFNGAVMFTSFRTSEISFETIILMLAQATELPSMVTAEPSVDCTSILTAAVGALCMVRVSLVPDSITVWSEPVQL